MVQRDGYGISKQIQLDDGREINIQRPYNGQAQVQISPLPQASSPGQQEVSVTHSNSDFEIIARSMMRRIDQLESQMQVVYLLRLDFQSV